LSWRREVEALVRPPRDMPALFVALERGIPEVRIVHAGGAFFDFVESRADLARAATDAAGATRPVAESASFPFPDASVGWLVLSFLGDASDARRRAAVAAEVARVTAPGATIVAVDHNRPRQLVAALGALVRAPRPPRWLPLGAWRRLAYPTARELRAAGLTVERLRFAGDERIQVISARRGARNGYRVDMINR